MSITFEVPDITQILAWIGALTGVGALLWQVLSWRRLSHNVRVSSTNAWFIYDDVAGEAMVCVIARNLGTSAVTITGWGISIGSENAVNLSPSPQSAQTPHRLEPGAEANFHMPSLDLFDRQAASGEKFKNMRPWVRLATGKQVTSRRGIPLRTS